MCQRLSGVTRSDCSHFLLGTNGRNDFGNLEKSTPGENGIHPERSGLGLGLGYAWVMPSFKVIVGLSVQVSVFSMK